MHTRRQGPILSKSAIGFWRDKEGIRQRRARLSDEGAAVCWNRFLMLVQFVDETLAGSPQDPSPGYLQGVKDYLEPGRIQQFLDYYAWEDKVSKGYAGPYSTGWIETIQRSLSALRDPFLKNSMSEAAFKAWCDKKTQQTAGRLRPEGGTMFGLRTLTLRRGGASSGSRRSRGKTS